jgi:SAM-dependent methyltransferase
MTRSLLSETGNVSVANMFEYEIEENKFDLIISIATIHHGLKSEINSLIVKIYKSLLPNGKIFITIPSPEGRLKWDTFKNNIEVGPGTYSPNSGPEKGLPHSFYSREEIINIFKDFKDLKINLDKKSRWVITGTK